MRYLIKYKLFENLEDEIDLDELGDYLIDFKQMDLDWDVSIGGCYTIDWDKFNRNIIEISVIKRCYMYFDEIRKYNKGIKGNNIFINLELSNKIDLNDLLYGYNTISDYLFSKHSLKLNYIFMDVGSHHYSDEYEHLYFENLKNIRIWAYGGNYRGIYIKGKYRKGEKIEASRISFVFKK